MSHQPSFTRNLPPQVSGETRVRRFSSFPSGPEPGLVFSLLESRCHGIDILRISIIVMVLWLVAAGAARAAETKPPDQSSTADERPGESGKTPGATPRAPSKAVEGRVFEPPPVPEFMLKKPAKPLTVEEMKKQADEAAERARRARESNEAGGSGTSPGIKPAGEADSRQKM